MKYADILDVHESLQPIHDIKNKSIATYNLISATIKKKDTSKWEKLKKRKLESNLKFDLLIHRLLRGDESRTAIKSIKTLFPIHPYSAYLLVFIAQHSGSTEQTILNFLHDSNKGFLKFIRECPQNEFGYFLTADYLWDSFLGDFKKTENLNFQTILKYYNLYSPDLEKRETQYLAVFKTILLLNILSQIAMKDESVKELVYPSVDNIRSMFIGTQFEEPISEVLLFIASNEYIQKTDDDLLVASESLLHSKDRPLQEDDTKSENLFTDWINTLPFPLASILWLYHVRNRESDKERYEILLHFFEALSEFYATVLLSGFQRDDSLYKSDIRKGLQESFLKNNQKIDKSSFGIWVNITAFLSKYARTMYNSNKEERAKCERLFGVSDKKILEMLFSRKIIKELQKTNGYRNTWSGHRGAISQKIACERREILEAHLSTVKQLLERTWENFTLIRAGESRYEGDYYNHTVEMLMGYATPFKQCCVEAVQAMVYGSLYLFNSEDKSSLRLLPVIKVLPSPKTDVDACYFYNRMEGDKIRFISYHFEPEPEIHEDAFHDTAKVIHDLLVEEKQNESV